MKCKKKEGKGKKRKGKQRQQLRETATAAESIAAAAVAAAGCWLWLAVAVWRMIQALVWFASGEHNLRYNSQPETMIPTATELTAAAAATRCCYCWWNAVLHEHERNWAFAEGVFADVPWRARGCAMAMLKLLIILTFASTAAAAAPPVCIDPATSAAAVPGADVERLASFGNAHFSASRHAASLACYERAVALQPDYAVGVLNVRAGAGASAGGGGGGAAAADGAGGAGGAGGAAAAGTAMILLLTLLLRSGWCTWCRGGWRR